MQKNILVKQLMHIVLIIIVGHFLIPSQLVAAKPLASFTDCATQTQIPESECNALVTLYNNMGGANWYDHTDWLQTDTPCSWYGVTCSSGTNITSLLMIENNMSGAIPAELANLTQLSSLQLVKNILTSSIPPELGSLTNLTILSLGSNSITGSIPPELGNLINLTMLDLGGNELNGSIPTELTNLTHLTGLNLGENSFSGSIPTWLGSMTSLTSLSLYQNNFSGSIPPELGNLTNLTSLSLEKNMLTGLIPPELGNLSNLTGLYLFENTLSNAIPAELGNLTQLQYLSLHHNNLTGSIPTSLGNLTQLTSLRLNDNSLTGSPPEELGNMTSLKTLYLQKNQLTGAFSTSITNLTNLMFISFDCPLMPSDPAVITFFEDEVYWMVPVCPRLIAPLDGTILDNGRTDKLDDIVWDFDWADIPGSTLYELYVSRVGAVTPLINKTNISTSSYHFVLPSYITQNNLSNWEWKVRAYLNDEWIEWSVPRTFSVESPNTDPFELMSKNGGFNTYTGTFRTPKYWKASNFSTTDGKNTKIKQEGIASVQMSGVKGKTKTISQTISAQGPAGDRFIFSYIIKGTALPTTGVCKGQVLFYKANILKSTKTLLCPKQTATFAFKKMTLQSIAPVAYDKIVIIFTYSKPGGTIWLDNVRLTR